MDTLHHKCSIWSYIIAKYVQRVGLTMQCWTGTLSWMHCSSCHDAVYTTCFFLMCVQGYFAPAMVNYLSLLGWNDGTEREIYSPQDLCEAFDVGRITKSAAVFDKTKLGWMNGQHLR